MRQGSGVRGVAGQQTRSKHAVPHAWRCFARPSGLVPVAHTQQQAVCSGPAAHAYGAIHAHWWCRRWTTTCSSRRRCYGATRSAPPSTSSRASSCGSSCVPSASAPPPCPQASTPTHSAQRRPTRPSCMRPACQKHGRSHAMAACLPLASSLGGGAVAERERPLPLPLPLRSATGLSRSL